MGKSIEEILKQLELERSKKLNEEQSDLDEINRQRDINREEWNKRYRFLPCPKHTDDNDKKF